MSLTATIKSSIAGTQTSALDLGTASYPFSDATAISLDSGTGANQADVLFTDTRTLTASATEDLDVSGALASALGGSAVFARVKAIKVSAAAGNTNNVNVTRPATNGVPLFLAAGDGIAVRPGGFIEIAAPDATAYAVTAGTGDLITFTNSAGSTPVTYTVTIIGASA